MGNTQTKTHDVAQVDFEQWKQAGIHREIQKIVTDQSGNKAELQSIPFNPKHDLQKQLEIYQYRKTQDSALVKCLGVKSQLVNTSSLCGSSHLLKVLTERILLRLNQFPQLSFPQVLYVLSEALRGYKECYLKLGSFFVDGEMIGVNQEGELKVWVNQNFAQNHPMMEKPLLQTSGSEVTESIDQNLMKHQDETDMVDNIVKMIQKKCQNGRFPLQFNQRIYKTPMTFDQMFRQIELFSRMKGLFVPDRLDSLVHAVTGRMRRSIQVNDTLGMDQRPFFNERISPNNNYPPSRVSRKLFPTDQTPLQGTQRLTSPQIYPGQSALSQTNTRLYSPIKVLFKRPTQQMRSPSRIGNYQGEIRSSAVSSKVTFRLMSPQNSTMTFRERNDGQFGGQQRF